VRSGYKKNPEATIRVLVVKNNPEAIIRVLVVKNNPRGDLFVCWLLSKIFDTRYGLHVRSGYKEKIQRRLFVCWLFLEMFHTRCGLHVRSGY